jgi:DNA-binding CsgD family transcriptional regulator
VRRAILAGEFVGRSRELGILRAALEAARAGPAPLVVVHGESGIGKTRTVAEFARGAEQEGAAVLWGTCFQGGISYPYGPWSQAIGRYLDGVAPDRLEAALGSYGAALASLAPAAPLPAGQERTRLFEAVVGCLEAIEGTPVLVLDDLQWAEPDTLELLVHVARFAPRPLIVALHRGRELTLAHPAARRLAEVGRHRPYEYIELTSLPRDDAAQLLERLADRPLDQATVTAIYAESGGNAFFLSELGRHLQRHGQAPSVPGWRPPETVRQAVALRLGGLSAEAREMLGLASVFTAGFSFAELAALTDMDEPALLDRLDEALAAEVLQPVGPDAYDFAHALVRHTIYEGLSESRRVRLHRRLAEALERLPWDRRELAAELAREYHASAALPGAERGVPYALSAADAARAARAPGDAEAFLRIALELSPADDLRRARILGELALLQAESARFVEAQHTLERALERLEALGADGEEIAALVYRVLSVVQDVLIVHSDLEPLIARGLAALGEKRGLVWARLKLLERPHVVQSTGPVYAARFSGFDAEAIRIALERGTEADQSRTVHLSEQWTPAALEEFMARVSTWRDPASRLRGLLMLGLNATVTRWACGPLPADRLCAELEALAEQTGSVPARTLAAVFRAALHGARGEFVTALETIERAVSLAKRMAVAKTPTVLAALVRELTLQHVEPQWARVGERIESFCRWERTGPWYGLLWGALGASAFARAGFEDRARALLAQVLPAIIASHPWHPAQGGSVSYAGEAIWTLEAAELAEPLLRSAQAVVEAEAGDYYMANTDLTVARLAALLGRREMAATHFARARSTLDARGHRPLRAILDHDEGIARQRLGQPGAAELLRTAAAQFEALGMTGWTRRPAPRTGLPDGLTPREAEVLRLVASGGTNREIADRLVLSVHTVERHLANAYRKISARNRADASAYVVRVAL